MIIYCLAERIDDSIERGLNFGMGMQRLRETKRGWCGYIC